MLLSSSLSFHECFPSLSLSTELSPHITEAVHSIYLECRQPSKTPHGQNHTLKLFPQFLMFLFDQVLPPAIAR